MSVRNDLVNVEENEYFDQKTRKFALTNAPWIPCVSVLHYNGFVRVLV